MILDITKRAIKDAQEYERIYGLGSVLHDQRRWYAMGVFSTLLSVKLINKDEYDELLDRIKWGK